MDWFILTFLSALSASLVLLAGGFLLRGTLMNWAVDRVLVRLLKDRYSENLWDVAIGITRVPPHTLLELELRADYGHALVRPLGSVRRLPHFAGIAFNPAQLVRAPLSPRADVDLTTVIGPRARCPLRLEMPILVGALPYGVAFSRPFVLALSRGASEAGTAYNAGAGPLLDEVLDGTTHLILQYTGGAWARDHKTLARAAMVEIHYGHGGRAALGRVIRAAELPRRASALMGMAEDGEAMIEAPLPGAATPSQLRELVRMLRRLTRGKPVGVKLAATDDLEAELAIVLEAGVDVIALDGSQGGTQGSPPIIADDFGIPTLHALHRAVRFLERSHARREVSLIIGGGLYAPGEMLKALALGADAVYLGTAVMMAGTHGQLSKAVPFEPITQICWANGKKADEFDADKGAQTVANFLRSCAGELAEGARALGKESIRDVTREDLVALDRETAATLGLPGSWRPCMSVQAPQLPLSRRARRKGTDPSGPPAGSP